MTFPIKALLQALDVIESEDAKKHLITCDNIAAAFPDVQGHNRLSLVAGFTNHPAFTVESSMYCQYFLNPNMSASKALIELIGKYQTTVVSDVAVMIAYYLAILNLFIELHGEAKGFQRFDLIFGSDKTDVPIHRRLKLSPAGPLMGVEMTHFNGAKLCYQPLAYIFTVKHYQDKAVLFERAPMGSIVKFHGDIKNYLKKHPAGVYTGYIGFVEANAPFKFRAVFQPGVSTEDALRDLHIASFNQEPSLESQHYATVDPTTVTLDNSKIKGFLTENQYVCTEHLNVLLNAPVALAINYMDLHYHTHQVRQLQMDLPRNLSLLDEDTDSDPPELSQSPSAFLMQLGLHNAARREKRYTNSPSAGHRSTLHSPP